jgi:hypothetical protein
LLSILAAAASGFSFGLRLGWAGRAFLLGLASGVCWSVVGVFIVLFVLSSNCGPL